jgi:hypothetical protein
MTEDEPKESGDVIICRYLSARLKDAYTSDKLSEFFKDETVEFQSTPHELGWVIHWVFKGSRMDYVVVNTQKSSQWTESTWEIWADEVVRNWIDAYWRPMVDTVDLDSVEVVEVSEQVEKKWVPVRDRPVPIGINVDFQKIENSIRAFQELERVLAMKGQGVPRVIIDYPKEGNPKFRLDSRIPVDMVGKDIVDKFFTDSLQVKTRCTLSEEYSMIVFEFSHPRHVVPSFNFSMRAWEVFTVEDLIRELKDHLARSCYGINKG